MISGLVKLVDQKFMMAYNYRRTGSTVTGPVAPIDRRAATVKIHMKRFLAYTPREKVIMGVP